MYRIVGIFRGYKRLRKDQLKVFADLIFAAFRQHAYMHVILNSWKSQTFIPSKYTVSSSIVHNWQLQYWKLTRSHSLLWLTGFFNWVYFRNREIDGVCPGVLLGGEACGCGSGHYTSHPCISVWSVPYTWGYSDTCTCGYMCRSITLWMREGKTLQLSKHLVKAIKIKREIFGCYLKTKSAYLSLLDIHVPMHTVRSICSWYSIHTYIHTHTCTQHWFIKNHKSKIPCKNQQTLISPWSLICTCDCVVGLVAWLPGELSIESGPSKLESL